MVSEKAVEINVWGNEKEIFGENRNFGTKAKRDVGGDVNSTC